MAVCCVTADVGLDASLKGVSASAGKKVGNQWVDELLRLPLSEVTGTAEDESALVSGTYSDEASEAEMAESDR
jgi:hypothetical protein